MSYLVLARKHRPQTFDDVIGQEHITNLLIKGIETGHLAHAYLFSGPRGVGKTTCARILAMCLNCEDGPQATPPADSIICREIAEGRSFDVLEIDGASNRGIDEIRMLRENISFAPTVAKFKIYIVDEVHMLTTEAFNALLKTLEEPPAHVKFIFATTEPNKLPQTIISRCQRFDFKRIAMNRIVDGLKAVSKKEKYKIDESALFSIAKAAQGSLRDALSILDQLSALSEDGIKEDDVYGMLGLVEVELLFALVDHIAQQNCAAALQDLDTLISKGKDVKQLLKDLTEHFRHLMVVHIGGTDLKHLVDYPASIKERLWKQSQEFDLPKILKAIDTLIKAQEDARITESLRMPLEVALAKLTFSENLDAAVPSVKAPRAQPAPPKPRPAAKPRLNEKTGSAAVVPVPKASPSPADPPPADDEGEEDLPPEVEMPDPVEQDIQHVQKVWDVLTSAVSKEKMSVATYLQEGYPQRYEKDFLVIGFPPHCSFQMDAVGDQKNTQMVERIFADKLRQPVKIKLETVAAQQDIPVEEKVQKTLDSFGGKVVNRWHNES
ncbi:MAG: DNA polymerase III subunit gamma/tau [Candidatus Omnitrophica bacterium]|nr:DNA polymerase III subunit gamma/tau [Candidatus Omnitrophota bacterium]MCB9721511.1 DNA polymerase III subunit gamma/tau [Candidatus Omnitrophota bacterium]